MEINAKVYAVANDQRLLQEVHHVLTKMTLQTNCFPEVMEPCAVLPLSQTWYGFTEPAEPTDGPEGWLACLRECAGILLKNGAVVVEYRSPDFPDDYLEYAYTTSRGQAGSGSRPAIIGYTRATGSQDLAMAMDEMFSGRRAYDRVRECKRLERKEAARREKGDFEITEDGVLKKYRGKDKDVVIPEGVKVIGDSAFVDMKGVERMLLEDEEYDAPKMKTLTVPDGVTEIGEYAFAYCMNLKKINLPDSITAIGLRAFEGCESLEKIDLPANLAGIEESVFFLCENLKTVTIPDSVRYIGNGAFWGTAIRKITLPKNLTRIGEKAFYGCEIKKVMIPDTVTEIGENAFSEETRQVLLCGDRSPEEGK